MVGITWKLGAFSFTISMAGVALIMLNNEICWIEKKFSFGGPRCVLGLTPVCPEETLTGWTMGLGHTHLYCSCVWVVVIHKLVTLPTSIRWHYSLWWSIFEEKQMWIYLLGSECIRAVKGTLISCFLCWAQRLWTDPGAETGCRTCVHTTSSLPVHAVFLWWNVTWLRVCCLLM